VPVITVESGKIAAAKEAAVLSALNNLSDLQSVATALANLGNGSTADFLRGDGTWQVPGGTVLSRAAVLTANGNASANTIVPVNTTSSAVTVTLPNAPATGTVVAVKCIIFGSGNNVTIDTAGSDVFNKAGGGTSLTLSAVNQGVYLSYDSATAIWTDLADDLPLTYLQSLFLQAANNLSDLASASAARTSLGLGAVATEAYISGQYLCTPTAYAPGTETTETVTGTSLAAFSSSNINTGAFTAPASGSVIVTANFTFSLGTASTTAVFGLATHGSTTPVANLINFTDNVQTVGRQISCVWLVTNLSRAAPHQP
jgi:hypothetical protein